MNNRALILMDSQVGIDLGCVCLPSLLCCDEHRSKRRALFEWDLALADLPKIEYLAVTLHLDSSLLHVSGRYR